MPVREKIALKKIHYVLQPERAVDLDKLTINKIEDVLQDDVLRVTVNELPREITLWEGEDYQKKGDWTYEEVETRLLEVLNVQ